MVQKSYQIAFMVCVLSLGGTTKQVDDANILDIGGIFPIEGKGGWQGGQVNLCYKRGTLALLVAYLHL